MSVLSRDQRSAERHQTFYTAFAYVRKGDNWSRHAVKVFDQSYNGVRLRSMQNLGGEELYVQLDMTSPVVALCHTKRVHPVARNCWEFGIELGGLAEIHSVIPQEVIERFCDAGTAQHVSAVIEVPNASPQPSPVDELSDLIQSQLNLAQPSPEPATEPETIELAEEPVQSAAIEEEEPVAEPEISVEMPEPVVEEKPSTEPLVQSPEPFEADQIDEPAEIVAELSPMAVEDALDLLVQTVDEEPVSSTPTESPAIEAPEVSVAEIQPPSAEEPANEVEPVPQTPAIDDIIPEIAALSDATEPEFPPDPEAVPHEEVPSAIEETTADVPVAAALQVPAIPRPKFLQTVAVGFVGLSELAIAALKVPAHAVRQQFLNRKSEEEKRLEWLQICAGTVNPPEER